MEDNEINVAVFTKDVKDYAKRRNVLKENVQKLYLVVWEQCSKQTRTTLATIKDFNEIKEDNDIASLPREIKGV